LYAGRWAVYNRDVRAALMVSLLVAAAGSAYAASESDEDALTRGLAAYEALDYRNAIRLLEEASHTSLTRDEQVQCYRTLAFAHASVGEPDAAREAFKRLLRVDPAAQLDRTVSPKLSAIFEQARAAVSSVVGLQQVLPVITPTVTPPRPRGGEPLRIEIAYPGGAAADASLFHRVAGEVTYQKLSARGTGAGRFQFTLPPPAVRPPAIEYHVVVLDERGAALALAGSLARPLSLGVERKKVAWYRRGWTWGVIVGVAAAAGAAAGLGVGLWEGEATHVRVVAR
jgi:tetratricopeptide (TPR) repeat protein